jgi:hypothetical protein
MESPLLSFSSEGYTGFMIQACELKELRLVEVLKDKYAPSIKRDPAFDKYLKQIEVTVFGQAPPTGDEVTSIISFFSR